MAHAHTHDDIDWAARTTPMRRADDIQADVSAAVARRLLAMTPPRPTVVDVGSGTGGMAVAFAESLPEGGRLALVDAVPALLEVAARRVPAVPGLELTTVLAAADDPTLPDLVPPADLVWASGVVHHLPDQQAALAALTRLLTPGGRLALREGGLPTRCLPWDLGLGTPGLQDRLLAARDTWFATLRTPTPRLPVGWNIALTRAGLTDVESFTYLVDLPAPASLAARHAVADWLGALAALAAPQLTPTDQTTLRRLLDPDSPDWIVDRQDTFILGASTVFTARKA
ncbi:class I SAM-dependent methyltransferase [Actinokineospora inagensis]|uniref:class I SAM-dependent methyltransferase n=1 Tax=Actinokineospora inagensis TaxID=103730 RepID=UPI0004010BFD|nr:class I SAM-dependent methyltransferase [Actinokineospora inagensis]